MAQYCKKTEIGNRLAMVEEVDDNIIVPVDQFLNTIADKTGWKKDEFLRTKDIGNVERKLFIRARKPNDIKEIPLKRGKSRSEIYAFVGIEERLFERAIVTRYLQTESHKNRHE